MNLILIFLPYLALGFGLGSILNKIDIARRTDSGVMYKRSGDSVKHSNDNEIYPFLF